MKKTLICLLLAILASSFAAIGSYAQELEFAPHGNRMDRSRLNIGVYHLAGYARSENHIRDIADCGIDFVMYMNNDSVTLDLFSKYGVGAVNVGAVPLWWGGFGDNAGTMRTVHPIEVFEAGAAKFKDHPAIWGISIVDEPSCLDFEYLGELVRKVNELFPNQFAHINLHPIYAPGPRTGNDPTKGALGTASYKDYIDRYCALVPTDYISYDFYYQNGGVQQDYANMRIVADACRRTGRSMWTTVQVNSSKLQEWISLNQLRFQAFSAMAFGAENITWACYTFGWWYNQVIDGAGNKTQQYDKLKQTNAEIHTLAEPYMKYKTAETYCVGFEGTTMLEGSGEESIPVYGDEVFSELTAGCPILVGRMEARDGGRRRALFICLADDPYDINNQPRTLTFKSKRPIRVTTGDGPLKVKRKCGGRYEIPVQSNQGLFIETVR